MIADLSTSDPRNVADALSNRFVTRRLVDVRRPQLRHSSRRHQPAVDSGGRPACAGGGNGASRPECGHVKCK
jgi:hypothetical protein